MFKVFLFFFVLLSFKLFSQEIKIIELHEKNIKREIEREEVTEEDVLFNEDQVNIINEQQESEDVISEKVNIFEDEKEVQKEFNSSTVLSIQGYWEQSQKEDLYFLFNNIKKSSSKVINSYFTNSLIEFSKAPKSYSQAEFDNLRIKTLIMMKKKQEALLVLNNINTYESYRDYYDFLKLDSYLATNELTQACDFNDSLKESFEDKKNVILKISIFCSFLENKIEELEADEFAGFVLGRLGAKFSQIENVFRGMSDSDDTYSTHPKRSKRIS